MNDVNKPRWQFPKHDDQGLIQCPHCGSKRWRCWDERTDEGLLGWDEDSRDEFDDQVWRVIGYLACLDCKQGWLDENPPFPLPAGWYPEGHGSWSDLKDIPF